MYTKHKAPQVGRSRLEESSLAVKKSVVLTASIMKAIKEKKKIEIHGDLSKYIRYLIEKDIRNE